MHASLATELDKRQGYEHLQLYKKKQTALLCSCSVYKIWLVIFGGPLQTFNYGRWL